MKAKRFAFTLLPRKTNQQTNKQIGLNIDPPFRPPFSVPRRRHLAVRIRPFRPKMGVVSPRLASALSAKASSPSKAPPSFCHEAKSSVTSQPRPPRDPLFRYSEIPLLTAFKGLDKFYLFRGEILLKPLLGF